MPLDTIAPERWISPKTWPCRMPDGSVRLNGSNDIWIGDVPPCSDERGPQTPAMREPHRRAGFIRFLEHLAIGAGTEVGISQAAGGSQKYTAGLLAAAGVAGFKEGADAWAGRDTKKQAAWHALSIVLGAGIAVAIKH